MSVESELTWTRSETMVAMSSAPKRSVPSNGARIVSTEAPARLLTSLIAPLRMELTSEVKGATASTVRVEPVSDSIIG